MLYAKRKKIKENLEKLKKSNPNPPVVSQHLSWQEEMAVAREMGREDDTSGVGWGGGGARTMCNVERRTQVRGGRTMWKGGHKWGGGEQVSTPTCTD